MLYISNPISFLKDFHRYYEVLRITFCCSVFLAMTLLYFSYSLSINFIPSVIFLIRDRLQCLSESVYFETYLHYIKKNVVVPLGFYRHAEGFFFVMIAVL